ncbi:MAG: glycoside hydrolase family 127 protein [Polyangiaceae bacterium]|nr:glycoside hydrolase family 127 protein [Polyangiaceae bacterium]
MKTLRKLDGITPVSVLAVPLLCAVFTVGTASAQSGVDKLQEFPLDEVQITDEYQTNLFDKDVAYLITTLDSDRLLAGFKAVSQGTNPANLYGGWESTNIRGHSMGHWLTAVAQAYRQAEGSDVALASQIKAKLDDVVSKLQSYQLSSGFLFASPMSEFDNFDNGSGGWVPYYTMHKILAGLIDVYKYEGNTDALAVASKLGDWINSRANGWSSSSRSRVLGQEYGGMNDALYELYKLTNNANHLAVAHVFDDTSLFTTTASGNDTLNGKHANTTIPKFIGALNRYRTLGSSEQSYFNAADKFLSIVQNSHSYVTGGNSQDEHFHEPGRLDARRDNVNNETCNSYNMSKLARDLFRVTGDVKYADFYERIHINEILASMNPDTGMTTYFKAMGTGYFKVFGSATNHFWCCTGTGMENFTKLNDSVYFHDGKDLWVTYYVSSTLDWKERGLSLTQTTELPLTNNVTFTIDAAPTDAVSLKFRKPDWTSTCAMAVAVNGQVVTPVESDGFLAVSRVWQAGDTAELAFPLFVQVSRLQDNQNSVAFTYGPLVLSAGLGTASMTTASHGVQVLKATKPTGLQETIAVNGGSTINDWLANIQSNLVQTAGKLEFNLKNTDSDGKLVFIPHYSRYQDRYGIYWKLSGASGGTATTNLVCPTVTAGGTDGSGGAGGASGTGGTTSAGGRSAGGGTTSAGGQSTSGGATSTGGRTGVGGRSPGGSTGVGGGAVAGNGGTNAGGLTGSGGAEPVGGGNGGSAGTAVSGGSGGTQAGAGGPATGGAGDSGGMTAAAGRAGTSGGAGGTGGSAAEAGASIAKASEQGDEGGCGCRVAGRTEGSGAAGLLLSLGLLFWTRRRPGRTTHWTRHSSRPTAD